MGPTLLASRVIPSRGWVLARGLRLSRCRTRNRVRARRFPVPAPVYGRAAWRIVARTAIRARAIRSSMP